MYSPPPYLLKEGKIGSKKYWTQVAYYEAVKKLPKLELKYARLTGGKGNLKEKNLDTQLTADMIRLAAENSFDTAILVASDGDYQAAVETVRNFEKIIELLYFKGSISMALKRVCDIVRRARRSYFEPLNFPTVDNE